jgi:putative ABC transport system substrate-binding protein
MRRRDFMTLLGGAAAAWPLAAWAQQGIAMVGILMGGPPGSLPQYSVQFRRGLTEMGYVEGRNLALEYRYAQDRLERVPELAADLIRRRVDVLVPLGSDAVAAATKAATTTIPVVFEIGGDPVEAGFVASLNRPGGNLTGVTAMNAELGAKRLGLLHDLLPQARRMGTIINGNSPATALVVRTLQAAASRIGVEIQIFHATDGPEIEAAFASVVQARVEALVVTAGPPFGDHIAQIATLAARHALPVIYYSREAADIGGLMTYATSIDRVRQVGIYVGRILKGEKPGNLPVLLPTKFEFIINLQTARALGIEVPPTLLSIADDVIE